MKAITSSIPDFEKLISENYLYVDKTEYIWQLIHHAGESFFLSRPRRFGKSLTVSTLEAVFQGKKELFKGLAIYDKPYDWKPYPIIHLSFGDYTAINNTIEKLLGISITAESKTNNGRIDAVAANDDFVFVFEFKLDKTAEIALDQIKDRDYYRRYMNSGKRIILVGVNFDKDAGQIDKWTMEMGWNECLQLEHLQ